MAHAETEDDAAVIRQIVADNDLPESVASLAVSIHTQALDAGFRRVGDDRDLPGAVYAAARVNGEPVRPRTLAAFVGVDGDDVVSDMRRLIDTLPYELTIEKPENYVGTTLDLLGASDEMRAEADRLLNAATDDDGYAPSGMSPSVFAAAVVYAASTTTEAGYTQADVADAAGTGKVSIRRSYRDVLDAAGYDAPDGSGDRDVMHDTVDRVLDAAGNVPDVVYREAHDLIDAVPDVDWVTRTNPHGVGAGAAYVAAKDNRVSIAQDAVADYAGVSKGTVVSRINDIRSWRGTERAREDRIDDRVESLKDDYTYNEMKRIASERGLGVGSTPSIDALARAIAEDDAAASGDV